MQIYVVGVWIAAVVVLIFFWVSPDRPSNILDAIAAFFAALLFALIWPITPFLILAVAVAESPMLDRQDDFDERERL